MEENTNTQENTQAAEVVETAPVKEQKKIDYLTEDTPIAGQEYYCVSFLSPEGINNCSVRGFKFRGAFPTLEAAQAHAKKLQKEDPNFHIYVGESGKWGPWDPDPNSSNTQEYYEEKLQDLMKGYLTSQEKGRQEELSRKRKMVEESIKREVEKRTHDANAVRSRMKQKLEARQAAVRASKIESEQMKSGQVTAASSATTTTENTADELRKINENLEKMKKLYQNLSS